MKSLRIAIIGAGTAGLAAANFLAKQSHQISIFEQATTLAPVGAGLLLQPSGLAVFNKLGVLNHACELGAPVSGLVGKLPSGKKIVNSFYKEAHPNLFGLGIHRATLCHVLQTALQPLPITWHMGCDVKQVRQHHSKTSNIQANNTEHDTSKEAIISFTQNGQPQQHHLAFDLVLICNGAKSALRPKAWTIIDKPYPWGAMWAIVPECNMLDTQILHQFYDGASIMMGILPTGQIPADNTITNNTPTDNSQTAKANSQKLSSVFWSLPSADIQTLLTSNKTQNARTQQIITETQKRWENVAQWLTTLPAQTKWLNANYRDVVMRHYGSGAIGILGDAAHAMSPQLGQGANMALLDAWAISEAVAKSQYRDDIWQHYHSLRQPSIRFYQRMSRLLTPFYQSHSIGLGKLRDMSFSWMYYFPWLRKQMALTISGVKTGPFSELDLTAIEAKNG